MIASLRHLRAIAFLAVLRVDHPELSDACPHVFVDGGIDSAFGDEQVLEALDVRWRFDAFETLD